jgi:hypothetical protein
MNWMRREMMNEEDKEIIDEKAVEIKQVSEREFWVGEHRSYLSEDNILHEIIVGDIDEKMTIELIKVGDKLRGIAQGEVDLLVDLNKAGKPTPEARRMGSKRFDKEGTRKVAIFGMNPVARVIASFVIGISKKKDIRFFKTEEEALTWLKENKK